MIADYLRSCRATKQEHIDYLKRNTHPTNKMSEFITLYYYVRILPSHLQTITLLTLGSYRTNQINQPAQVATSTSPEEQDIFHNHEVTIIVQSDNINNREMGMIGTQLTDHGGRHGIATQAWQVPQHSSSCERGKLCSTDRTNEFLQSCLHPRHRRRCLP